jgi:monovalent cation/proton antiporter MnhG/PhaG subunit
VILVALVLVTVGGAGFLYRLVRGPTLADRIVSLDGLFHGIVRRSCLSAYHRDGTYHPGWSSLVAFLGTSAFARFVEGRRRERPVGVPSRFGCAAALSASGRSVRRPVHPHAHGHQACTLGILLVAVGAMFRIEGSGAVTLLLLIIILQFVTGPVSAHLVGRAAHRHGDWDREHAVVDELAEVDEL